MDKSKIEAVIHGALENQNAFLVDLDIREGNNINVYADTDKGITIQELKMLSREIESTLDRDVEDFALEVSSPGLERPFRVKRQYKNNVGRWVKVTTTDNEILIGKLVEADYSEIVLNIPPDRKKKLPAQKKAVAMENISETKIEIRF